MLHHEVPSTRYTPWSLATQSDLSGEPFPRVRYNLPINCAFLPNGSKKCARDRGCREIAPSGFNSIACAKLRAQPVNSTKHHGCTVFSLTRECSAMLAPTIRPPMVLMASPQPSICPDRIDEYTSLRSLADGIWHEKVAKCRCRRSQISNEPAVGFIADRNCTSTICGKQKRRRGSWARQAEGQQWGIYSYASRRRPGSGALPQ